MAGIKKGAELRQKIIDTAWELFYENGYENTTVNDIIRKVGTSKGGFYYYFKAKEDLLNSLYSVFDREYEKFYENMDQNQDSLMKLKQLSLLGGMTEVALGTAVLVKNGIGMAGAVICIALCVIPLVQTAGTALLYKLAAAMLQPVSDERVTSCVEAVGEGCQILMQIVFTVGVLFLLTIAIVAAVTNA